MARSRGVRSWVALAAVAFVVLAAVVFAAVYIVSWRGKTRVDAKGGTSDFTWLTKTLDDCEAEASRYPGSLYFTVVPLSAATGSDVQSRAMDRVGPVALFDSKTAMEGLQDGSLRISRGQFVLHVLDGESSAVRRWGSVSGVSRLSERNNSLKGPFRIRVQTAPDEPTQWSSVTADGVATCHWVFALLPG